MNISFNHYSVMGAEIVSFFDQALGKTFVDATAGGGGHLSLLASLVGEQGKIFAFDRDARAHGMDAAGGIAHKHPRVIKLYKRAFSSIKETLHEEGITAIDGIICDLGVSSNQLDDRSRGFSFLEDGPLDMRMDRDNGISAYDWLAVQSEQAIADALFNFAGERKSRSIARLIKKSWPIENSTTALAKLVLSAVRQKHWSKIHPATRTFQAIRMAVNGEYDELSTLLSHLPSLLSVDGVAVFLSFHSGEDRLIKTAFRQMAKVGHEDRKFQLLNKKPLTASEQELSENWRSRSAKLRAIKRVA